jgi:hypothetical protein
MKASKGQGGRSMMALHGDDSGMIGARPITDPRALRKPGGKGVVVQFAVQPSKPTISSMLHT